jgi:hypothetical protein
MLDLLPVEDKVLIRQLQTLQGKAVIVTGELMWFPKSQQVNSEADYVLAREV